MSKRKAAQKWHVDLETKQTVVEDNEVKVVVKLPTVINCDDSFTVNTRHSKQKGLTDDESKATKASLSDAQFDDKFFNQHLGSLMLDSRREPGAATAGQSRAGGRNVGAASIRAVADEISSDEDGQDLSACSNSSTCPGIAIDDLPESAQKA